MIRVLKNGYTTTDPRLDRVPSTTSEHLDKYPLTAETLPMFATSMVFGLNWYENFDVPVRRVIRGVERFVVGEPGTGLGRLRGGHAVCARHWKIGDSDAWRRYYNQGQEGRCTEFAKLRMMTQLNRIRYDITSRWHYHTDQHADEWRGCYLGHDGATYEGTSVRAALEGLRLDGAIPAKPGGAPIALGDASRLVEPEQGIAAYRWATNWDDVRRALGVPNYLPGVPINNSWGINYPKEVLLLDDVGARLLREDGEFGIVTDK